MIGTHWGQGKKNKKSLFPPAPSPLQKEKKRTILIGCVEFLFPKMFITNLLPGLR
jgi:hypothetical protein